MQLLLHYFSQENGEPINTITICSQRRGYHNMEVINKWNANKCKNHKINKYCIVFFNLNLSSYVPVLKKKKNSVQAFAGRKEYCGGLQSEHGKGLGFPRTLNKK